MQVKDQLNKMPNNKFSDLNGSYRKQTQSSQCFLPATILPNSEHANESNYADLDETTKSPTKGCYSRVSIEPNPMVPNRTSSKGPMTPLGVWKAETHDPMSIDFSLCTDDHNKIVFGNQTIDQLHHLREETLAKTSSHARNTQI